MFSCISELFHHVPLSSFCATLIKSSPATSQSSLDTMNHEFLQSDWNCDFWGRTLCHVIAGIQRNKKVETFSHPCLAHPLHLADLAFCSFASVSHDFIRTDTVHTIKPQVEVIRTGVPVGAGKISKKVPALPERLPWSGWQPSFNQVWFYLINKGFWN